MLFVLAQRSLIRNKTQTAVTNMRLKKRTAKIEFHSLTLAAKSCIFTNLFYTCTFYMHAFVSFCFFLFYRFLYLVVVLYYLLCFCQYYLISYSNYCYHIFKNFSLRLLLKMYVETYETISQ